MPNSFIYATLTNKRSFPRPLKTSYELMLGYGRLSNKYSEEI